MSKEKSNKISNINFIMTLFVVLIHSNCIDYADKTSEYYIFFAFAQKFLNTIFDIAVPTFFAISSFLFFRNLKTSDYNRKIKKRFHSLLIPYLFWSFFFLIYIIIITNINLIGEINTTMSPIMYDLVSFLKYIVSAEYAGSLWYVQVLMILVLISPLLHFIIKKIKNWNALLITILFIINMIIKPNYTGCIYWLPLYYLIGYIVQYFKTDDNKIRKLLCNSKMYIYLLYAVLFISVIFFNCYEVKYLYRMICPVFVYLLSEQIKILSDKPLNISKISFLIYCIHFNVVVAIKRILILIFGNNLILLFVFQFISGALAIFLIWIFALIMKKIAPKILNIISGNRTGDL